MDLHELRRLTKNVKRAFNSGEKVALDRIYYTHLRRYVSRHSPEKFDASVELSNHGGATIAFRVRKEVFEPGEDCFYAIEYIWADCNLTAKDQFCKKTGRDLCDNRLNDLDDVKPFYELSEWRPTIKATRDFVIEEYCRNKEIFYHNVWKEYY